MLASALIPAPEPGLVGLLFLVLAVLAVIVAILVIGLRR